MTHLKKSGKSLCIVKFDTGVMVCFKHGQPHKKKNKKKYTSSTKKPFPTINALTVIVP